MLQGDYDVSNLTYDANGNILSLTRNAQGAMDNLSYKYKTRENDPTLTKDYPNQLLRVDDTVPDNAVANADIDDQDGDNYEYNSIGQLVRNNAEDIDYFYNASGLVVQVDQGGQPAVKFFYNDRNHRIKKESYVNGSLASTTYYVRDVAGQVMAIYSNGGGSMALVERPIYGSGRIGVAYTSGNTVYELTDHLGNVRAVFTKDQGDAGLEGYTDYYPFGMPMPSRQMEDANQYRYSFQGQEKDPETGKEAFELRLWDSRIGRWLNPDPYGVHHSPYLGMANNPIGVIDRDGGIPVFVITGAIGAIINAGANVIQQGILEGKDVDWGRVAIAAGTGFIAGATGQVYGLGAAVAVNTVGDVGDQLLANGGDFSNISITQSLIAGGSTFLGGRIGGAIATRGVVRRTARNVHRFFNGRKYTNVLGQTVTQYSRSFTELDEIAFTSATEIIGGIGTAGLVNSTPHIIRAFDKPEFEYTPFENPFMFNHWVFQNQGPEVIRLPEITLTSGDSNNPNKLRNHIDDNRN